MPTPYVIDLSHHNTIPDDLSEAAESGIIGVIHKATEGSSYIDDKFHSRKYLADQAELLFGAYHFIRPGSKMEVQARHFLNVCEEAGLDDGSIYVCDYEDSGVSLDDVKKFMSIVKKSTGKTPVIYSGHVLKEKLTAPDPVVNAWPLWLAQYASTPVLPTGFKKYWLWQYTEDGDCPGVDSPVDLNTGEPEEIKALWRPSTHKKIYRKVITIESDSPINVEIADEEWS